MLNVLKYCSVNDVAVAASAQGCNNSICSIRRSFYSQSSVCLEYLLTACTIHYQHYQIGGLAASFSLLKRCVTLAPIFFRCSIVSGGTFVEYPIPETRVKSGRIQENYLTNGGSDIARVLSSLFQEGQTNPTGTAGQSKHCDVRDPYEI